MKILHEFVVESAKTVYKQFNLLENAMSDHQNRNTLSSEEFGQLILLGVIKHIQVDSLLSIALHGSHTLFNIIHSPWHPYITRINSYLAVFSTAGSRISLKERSSILISLHYLRLFSKHLLWFLLNILISKYCVLSYTHTH